MNDWSSVTSDERNDIVFEHRNKSYGAFVIRKEYTRGITIAFSVTAIAIILGFATPMIIDLIMNRGESEKVVAVDNTQIELDAPPPVDESEPPPPPPPPPPPMMETVKFVPPVVEDEKVEDQEVPPPQETETQVSTVTQEGSGEEIIVPTEGNGVAEPVKEEIFMSVEEMPQFPGGEAALLKYVANNIQYPQVEKENGIQGTCYVTFVVNKDGKVEGAEVLRGVSGGKNLDKEALRVISNLPAWTPGKQNGRTVKVRFNLPVKFRLQ